ncbi:MAG: hypothetical protein DWQ02_28265, partial [Bacteroidetes bacterium]
IYCWIWLPFAGFSQSNSDVPALPNSFYIGLESGMTTSALRDWATSPLFYRGKSPWFSVSFIKTKPTKRSNLDFAYSFGNFFTNTEGQVYASQVKWFQVNYSRLYAIKRLGGNGWSFELGGELSVFGDFRSNSSLMNNSFGNEYFATLSPSMAISKDISRKVPQEGKILFIKYKLHPRKQQIGAYLTPGLLNAVYRNDFSYINQSSVINDPNYFANYQLTIPSGLRLRSGIDYTFFLNNRNGFQIGYEWNFYKSSFTAKSFEMASHLIKGTILFNVK